MHDPLRPGSSSSPYGHGQSTAPADDPGPTTPQVPSQEPGRDDPAQPESAAVQRFRSCRWRKATTPEHCGHPEVLPFAGTNGFVAESWCPDCQFYKLRRVLPKRDY